LFSVSLAGDIVLCAPVSNQAELFAKMRVVFAAGLPTERDLIKWAQIASGNGNSKYILCAGEAACFLNPLFRGELEAHCEKGGYTLRYAPLSELLLFEMMENGSRAITKEALLKRVSSILGPGSPFAQSMSGLSKLADSVLGSCAANNGRCTGCSMQCMGCECRTLSAGARWRAGKTAVLPDKYYGLIRASSMYENTSSVFSLTDDSLGAKRLELRFEGALSAAEGARVDTWLHYLTK
jgi:hypothetical protein